MSTTVRTVHRHIVSSKVMYDAIQDFTYVVKVDSLLQSYGYSDFEIEREMVKQGNNASLKKLLQPRLYG